MFQIDINSISTTCNRNRSEIEKYVFFPIGSPISHSPELLPIFISGESNIWVIFEDTWLESIVLLHTAC